MKAKEFLKRLQNLTAAVKYRQQEIATLEESLHELHGIGYDDVKVQQSRKYGAGFEDMVAYLEKLKDELHSDISALAHCRHEIICRLNQLNNPVYTQVLYLKYVKSDEFDTIAASLGYSVGYVREMHSKAIKALDKILAEKDPLPCA